MGRNKLVWSMRKDTRKRRGREGGRRGVDLTVNQVSRRLTDNYEDLETVSVSFSHKRKRGPVWLCVLVFRPEDEPKFQIEGRGYSTMAAVSDAVLGLAILERLKANRLRRAHPNGKETP